jgi:hypothetical protein
MAPFRYGPSDHASPHQHIAHAGSSARASSNERRASTGVYAYISRAPWSKYACAVADRVATGQRVAAQPLAVQRHPLSRHRGRRRLRHRHRRAQADEKRRSYTTEQLPQHVVLFVKGRRSHAARPAGQPAGRPLIT